MILVLLVSFYFLSRLIIFPMMENNPDSVSYWNCARSVVNGIEYPQINHKTVRMGIISVEVLFLKVLSYSPMIWYLIPFLLMLVSVFFLYYTIKDFFSDFVILFTFLCFFMFPFLYTNSFNNMPETYSIFYMSGTAFFLKNYFDKKKILFLFISALFLFIAYQTKITNTFFVPGIFVFFLLFKSSKKHILLFFSFFFGFILIETAAVNILTEYSSRFDIILNSHLDQSYNSNLISVKSFWNLFDRFNRDNMPELYELLLVLFLVLFLMGVFGKKDKKVVLTGIVIFSFMLPLIFMVKSIDPIIPMSTFRSRYFKILLFPVFLVMARTLELYLPVKITEFFSSGKWYFFGFFVAFLFLIETTGIIPGKFDEFYSNPLKLSSHPVVVVPDISRDINSGIESAYYFSDEGNKEIRQLETLKYVFLDNENYMNPKINIRQILNPSTNQIEWCLNMEGAVMDSHYKVLRDPLRVTGY